ncbi:MAG: hypothetical protein ABI647_22760 [Gemmatimonadota bacterium]
MAEPIAAPWWLPVVLLGWLLAAATLAWTGRIAALRPPMPQAAVAALTIAVVVAGSRVASLRAWLATLDPRAAIALHLLRFVAGTAFLLAYSRGGLPRAFAVPGGIGDIAVAVLAVPLLIAPREAAWWTRAALLWNLFGLADILFVVVNAARAALADPGSMTALLHLPLSLLPTFLVPLIIASHLWLLRRGLG